MDQASQLSESQQQSAPLSPADSSATLLTSKIEFKSREDLPRIFNERGLLGVGIEVGVLRAEFLTLIRRNWKGRLLVGIDPWEPYFGADWGTDIHDRNHEIARCAIAEFGDSCSVVRASSIDAATEWDRGMIDFVYLDAAHHCDAVKADIAAWWPHIRTGGIICGHDWISDGWHQDGDPVTSYVSREAIADKGGAAEFGVRRAVAEMLSGHQLSVSSPAFDGGYQSWLVVKP